MKKKPIIRSKVIFFIDVEFFMYLLLSFSVYTPYSL